ncbi:phospholipid methyltransferase-domain-containing protein [Kockovaella imperatae]|uniref:Phosphatidyl-N-methylethanolamine N-methyltransferase n=1 Tax=Kockovaella imperatae TaxID=4999 RepID=A0A1Y1UQF6_9TREE|nr:phospholipid methyltransferase-domain-containing protein [Kockovaella imperatae]ORX40271.1 phospholipid methyltransferase-domain-containing protein [Kockovaella imperatae]
MASSKHLAADSLPAWIPLHHFNEPRWNYATGLKVLDLSQGSLWLFVGMTMFNPIFWNIVARNEYENKTITRIVKSPYVGCYILAGTIFTLSATRDSMYLAAIKDQPAMALLNNSLVKAIGFATFAAGQVFVLSSMWALGVTGTYLGDYFGILMSKRVTGFPFNVLNDPMYVGSFLSHLGTALWYESPSGILLAFWVLAVYMVALTYEGPFTDKIYSKKSGKKSASAASTPRKSARKSMVKKDESYADAVANGGPGVPSTQAKVSSGVQPKPVGSVAVTPRKTRTSKSDSTSPHMTRSRTGNTPGARRAGSDE